MNDKPRKPPDPETERKATPPPDDPARRSAEWEDLEPAPEDAEQFALLRLKALQSTKSKTKP